jgi:hypothetical protein
MEGTLSEAESLSEAEKSETGDRAGGASKPALQSERDASVPKPEIKGTSHLADVEASVSSGPGIVSIVPAPRPYGYRRPTGHPDEDMTAHPMRRRGDFDPQK